MNKIKKNIEKVFRESHLLASKQSAPVFSSDWQSQIMGEVRRVSRSANAFRNDEAPQNLFAFRLGWGMLCFAFAISAVFYMVGINPLHETQKTSESSLLELVDQSVNSYDVNLFDETGKVKEGDLK